MAPEFPPLMVIFPVDSPATNSLLCWGLGLFTRSCALTQTCLNWRYLASVLLEEWKLIHSNFPSLGSRQNLCLMLAASVSTLVTFVCEEGISVEKTVPTRLACGQFS